MILQDAADDGETEPRALFARSDIRFEQPAAVLLRQPDPVVDHIDDDVVAIAACRYTDVAAAELSRRHGGDRLGRALDDIREPLRDEPAVEMRRHRIWCNLHFDVDLGIADA